MYKTNNLPPPPYLFNAKILLLIRIGKVKVYNSMAEFKNRKNKSNNYENRN